MPRRSARSTERRRDPRTVVGSFEWMEAQLFVMGRETFEARERVGGDLGHVVTRCLVHGQHQAHVEWYQASLVRVKKIGSIYRPVHEVTWAPKLMCKCGPSCGPRFGWGTGCEHID